MDDYDALIEAAAEAKMYNRMGGLTKRVLEEIAESYDLDYRDILEEMEWGRDHYD